METQERVLEELYPVEQTESSVQLFSTDPETAFQEAQRIVNVVAKRCTGPGYLARINGKLYPTVSWWATIAATLSMYPRVVWSRRLDREGEIAYEARVEVHRNGLVISSGEALCSNREPRWREAPEHSVRAMAQTRAAGRSYRVALSFLAVMAGLEATPAEEMGDVMDFGMTTPQPAPSPTQDPATPKQINKLQELAVDERLSAQERTQLKALLLEGMTKAKASQLMERYFGKSVFQGGEWVRVSEGMLSNRKQHKEDGS